MKTILLITLMGAAAAHAQYTADWSEFDGGHVSNSAEAVTHAGIFSGWASQTVTSANYANQQGYPAMPMPVQTQGIPFLTISLVGDNARVAWPAAATNFVLEATEALGTGASWSSVPGPYQENGGERFILVPAAEASRYYRLAAP